MFFILHLFSYLLNFFFIFIIASFFIFGIFHLPTIYFSFLFLLLSFLFISFLLFSFAAFFLHFLTVSSTTFFVPYTWSLFLFPHSLSPVFLLFMFVDWLFFCLFFHFHNFSPFHLFYLSSLFFSSLSFILSPSFRGFPLSFRVPICFHSFLPVIFRFFSTFFNSLPPHVFLFSSPLWPLSRCLHSLQVPRFRLFPPAFSFPFFFLSYPHMFFHFFIVHVFLFFRVIHFSFLCFFFLFLFLPFSKYFHSFFSFSFFFLLTFFKIFILFSHFSFLSFILHGCLFLLLFENFNVLFTPPQCSFLFSLFGPCWSALLVGSQNRICHNTKVPNLGPILPLLRIFPIFACANILSFFVVFSLISPILCFCSCLSSLCDFFQLLLCSFSRVAAPKRIFGPATR